MSRTTILRGIMANKKEPTKPRGPERIEVCVSVLLTPSEKEILVSYAEKEGRSVSNVARRAINRYVEESPEKRR